MAYASAVAISVIDIDRTGKDVTTLATSPTETHGNKFLNDGRTYLEVANGSGSAVVATVNTPGTVDGLALADLAVSIPAGKRYKIGPFTATFNQSDGNVWVTFDAVTTVTIAAFRISNP